MYINNNKSHNKQQHIVQQAFAEEIASPTCVMITFHGKNSIKRLVLFMMCVIYL